MITSTTIVHNQHSYDDPNPDPNPVAAAAAAASDANFCLACLSAIRLSIMALTHHCSNPANPPNTPPENG